MGIDKGSKQTHYEYDGLGIRRRKDNVYYVVDQENTGNVLVESTQSGVGISTYIWGNGLVARVNPHSDSTYYYHYDFRGSVICITDQNGQVVQFYKYDPYGNIYAQRGSLTWDNPYQYLGRWGCQADDSDVYYCKARYYQPSTGRFLSEDPKWNTNLFIYGEDDPLNNIDPHGAFSLSSKVSLGESLIPVWGSYRVAMYNAKEGHYLAATGYGLLAVSDLIGVGEIVDGIKIINAGVKVKGAARIIARTYFEDARYSQKTIDQISKTSDIYHSFPAIVDVYASKYGQWTMEQGANGKLYEWLRLRGTFNGKEGIFEYIKDINGEITHRFFNVN